MFSQVGLKLVAVGSRNPGIPLYAREVVLELSPRQADLSPLRLSQAS
jgi:hypothetical protein